MFGFPKCGFPFKDIALMVLSMYYMYDCIGAAMFVNRASWLVEGKQTAYLLI